MRKIKNKPPTKQIWIEITPDLHERFVRQCRLLKKSNQFIAGRLIDVWVCNREDAEK